MLPIILRSAKTHASHTAGPDYDSKFAPGLHSACLFVWNNSGKDRMLRNSRWGVEQLVKKSAPAATTNADAGRKSSASMLRANHTEPLVGKPNSSYGAVSIGRTHSAVGEVTPLEGCTELWRDIRPVEWPVRVRSAIARRCFVAR